MTKKSMTLALALLAPAAFGQSAATAVHAVHAKKPKTIQANPSAGQVKVLQGEIKRDKGDMSGKVKSGRAERKQLLAQEKTELAAIKATTGTRAEKQQARLAVRRKYAQLMAEARTKNATQRKSLREDIVSKRGQIKSLRRS